MKLFKRMHVFILSFLILIGILLFPFSVNCCANAEDVLLFDDVVDVAAGIQYLAALKADGTVSLAKIVYPFEPGSNEAWTVDFENNEYRIPVDMDVLRSEVSTWENIKSIGILRFSMIAGDECEILIGLDQDGKLHAAFGFPAEYMEYCSEYVVPCVQVDDWSDVVSFATCRRLLMGVRSDGSLYLTGCLVGASEIEYLVKNATGVASVQLAWSAQGAISACLFRDGRVGIPSYDYESRAESIKTYAENVLDYDRSMGNLAALQDNDTVIFGAESIPDCGGIKQVCCTGTDLNVVKQNGDVCFFNSDKVFQETDLKNVKRLYTNHSGNVVYGLLGLTNEGSVITEWRDKTYTFTQDIDLSGWRDITDLFFPEEDITYVVGLNQNGNILISGNVTAEVY